MGIKNLVFLNVFSTYNFEISKYKTFGRIEENIQDCL